MCKKLKCCGKKKVKKKSEGRERIDSIQEVSRILKKKLDLKKILVKLHNYELWFKVLFK